MLGLKKLSRRVSAAANPKPITRKELREHWAEMYRLEFVEVRKSGGGHQNAIGRRRQMGKKY